MNPEIIIKMFNKPKKAAWVGLIALAVVAYTTIHHWDVVLSLIDRHLPLGGQPARQKRMLFVDGDRHPVKSLVVKTAKGESLHVDPGGCVTLGWEECGSEILLFHDDPYTLLERLSVTYTSETDIIIVTTTNAFIATTAKKARQMGVETNYSYIAGDRYDGATN